MASRRPSPSYRLAGAVYAYAFLFPEGDGATPGRFDPRLRIAADLYNWALMAPFVTEDGSEVVPRGGTFELPFGKIDVAFDPAALRAGDRELFRFVPIAELEVYGLAMRYRGPGIGAPLAASSRPIDTSKPGRDMVGPRLQVPLTALLRISDARRALMRGEPLTAQLELHLAWDEESITIAGERVPLESQPSAALALTFTGAPVMESRCSGSWADSPGLINERPPLVSTTPYRPGLIPVVFVHGTASSIVRWAEMYNRLAADPEIRSRYQFWFFQYDSGNPVALSALRLREALTAAVARLDPEGKDQALRRMVLIGHSQGGLLVKMQSISSGDRLWNAATTTPLDELDLSDQTRDLFRRGLFVEPVPGVSRVIFICTPHRGSFVAGRNVIANVTRSLVALPFTLTQLAADIRRNPGLATRDGAVRGRQHVAPAPFHQGPAGDPDRPAHHGQLHRRGRGDGPLEDGDDGVVKYTSAHIESVESELIVKSGHSTQGNPHTIEEVRRVLRLHMGAKPAVAETREFAPRRWRYLDGNANATTESPRVVPILPWPPAAMTTYCRPLGRRYVIGVAWPPAGRRPFQSSRPDSMSKARR